MKSMRTSQLASAARTATTTTAKQRDRRHSGMLVILNVTAASGTGGLTLSVRGYDPTSGTAFVLLTDGSAITATGAFAFLLGSTTVTAGSAVRVAAARPLTTDFDIQIVHGDASSYTYSLAAEMLP